MEILIHIMFSSRECSRALSENLQKYAAERINTLHFSFRSSIEIIKLAALLFRLFTENGRNIWLSPWQLKILWLSCVKQNTHRWFVLQYAAKVYELFPELSVKYPVYGSRSL